MLRFLTVLRLARNTYIYFETVCIQKAAEAADAGDTVHIKAGNYPENVQFQKSGETPGKYITFKNYDNDEVNLDPGSLEIHDKSYLKIIGLHIKNSPRDTPGIDVGGRGSHIVIQHNEITKGF